MHPEDEEPTRRPITRRAALAAFGTVSLGVLLEACSRDPDTSVTSAPVTTSDGAAATVHPQSPAGSGLAARFDDAATCSLSPEGTEGPFYFDVDSIRTNIVEDREGTPLRMGIRVQEAGACTAIANAVVDVWHCDANGSYSGFEAASQGGFTDSPTDEEPTCAARRSRTPTASPSSAPCTQGGTRGGPCTSTPKCTWTAPPCSRRSCTSTTA